MDRNLIASNMMPGASYGVTDLQGPIHAHQQPHPHDHLHQLLQQQPPHHYQHSGQMVNPMMHDVYPMSCGQVHEHKQQHLSPPVMDYNKGDRTKTSTSDEDEPGFNMEDGIDSQHDTGKGKKNSPWQRVKWTDSMIKLLITAVSYIGDDATSDRGRDGRRKFSILQKKGKWKLVSKVMAERGCYVSPQQCEDKFNDLNKRYKRLNDVLGRGTSCQVVENPALLDMMDHLSEKAKDDVRKILSSKHLFYEEMCSYHNSNRLHLPADPALQKSLQRAIQSKDDQDTRRNSHDDGDENDHGAESDDMENESEDNHTVHHDMGGSCFPKRLKQARDQEDSNAFSSLDCNTKPNVQGISVDMNVAFPEGSDPDMQTQWMLTRKVQLEEQSLQIQVQMLELERQRFKWQIFSQKKERELEKFRIENERMKFENERLALELRPKEVEVGLH